MKSELKVRLVEHAFTVVAARTEEATGKILADDVVRETAAYLKWFEEVHGDINTAMVLGYEQTLDILMLAAQIAHPVPDNPTDQLHHASQLLNWLVSRHKKNPLISIQDLMNLVVLASQTDAGEPDRIENVLKRTQKYVDLIHLGPKLN